MKLKRFRGDPILEKDEGHDWERGSVLNPGVIYENGFFRMIYRATNDVHPDIFSKAACLFPEKINGKYTMFFTFELESPKATIMMAQFDDLYDLFYPSREMMNRIVNEEYEDHVVFRPSDGRGSEVGAVPIKTPHGWLFIYSALSSVDGHTE